MPAVARAELTGLQRSDVQHSNQLALHNKRDSEQRPDALLSQDGVEDVRMVDVGDENRRAFGRDAPRETPTDRDPYPALNLFLDPLRRSCHQLL